MQKKIKRIQKKTNSRIKRTIVINSKNINSNKKKL